MNVGFNFDSIKEREGVTKPPFCQRTAWLLVNGESSFMTMHMRSGLRTEHDSHTPLFLFLPVMRTTRITQRIQNKPPLLPLSSLLRLLGVTFESVSAYCRLTYMPRTIKRVRKGSECAFVSSPPFSNHEYGHIKPVTTHKLFIQLNEIED